MQQYAKAFEMAKKEYQKPLNKNIALGEQTIKKSILSNNSRWVDVSRNFI